MLCDFGCGKPAMKLFSSSGKWCCSAYSSQCQAMRNKNNAHGESYLDYDWQKIQEVYDTGVSQRELAKAFGVQKLPIQSAVKHGLLKPRTRGDSIKIAIKRGKGKLSTSMATQVAEAARGRILERYENGWMPKAGRCKKYRYESPIAGIVYLDGTWELETAKWLDNKKYNWKRNTKRFQYMNLKNKISFYTPDFWVEELDGYLEIKGYETDLDRCKWSQFTEKLTVWKKNELKQNGVLP